VDSKTVLQVTPPGSPLSSEHGGISTGETWQRRPANTNDHDAEETVRSTISTLSEPESSDVMGLDARGAAAACNPEPDQELFASSRG